MLARQVVLTGLLMLGCSLAAAKEGNEETPDMEFLEYLGYWEGSDEEWLIFEESELSELDERSDPVPQGEESTETEDES